MTGQHGWKYQFFTPYRKGWPSKTEAMKAARHSIRNFRSCNEVTQKLKVVSTKIVVLMPEKTLGGPLGVRGSVVVVVETEVRR